MTKHQTIANAEEQHLAAMSAASSSSTTTSTKKIKKVVNKSSVARFEEEISTSANMTTLSKHDSSQEAPTMEANQVGKKKSKSKKSKKNEHEAQNISVKSSFSKFDALQKRNLIHNPQEEKEKNCRLCSKPVYKMEEIKAEKSIYHLNCFRCRECSKQLKVDNYQSHEGIPYCSNHFKSLFAPKTVEDIEPDLPRKPELIIRENQPEVLPPDVARASDKPDLGLDDLHQLNVRSRFQVFESGNAQEKNAKVQSRPTSVKRSTTILSKVAKLQAHGISGSISGGDDVVLPDSDSSSESEDEINIDSDQVEDGDADLVRARKRTRERPVGIGKAMDVIKTKFEKGPLLSKDERREERKQEIQSIRSRLFMGKQARIKEMYQQAVADSEQALTSAGKKPDVEIDGVTRSIKDRFENGDIFKTDNNENNAGITSAKAKQALEADVFESGISKQSRSIFMELDANVASKQNSLPILTGKPKETRTLHRPQTITHDESEGEIIKYDEKTDDVKVETSEISQKFKFFETYRPKECIKKEFRITPPREGVVKMPSPDKQTDNITIDPSLNDAEANLLEKSQTTAKMLNKFREMELNKNRARVDAAPRPLKCFTPPPDGGQRLYDTQESGAEESDDDYAEETSEEGEYDDESKEGMRRARQLADDEALKEAQAAARAKLLRAKFEKWEANEIQREARDRREIYTQEVSEDNIESTKAIRARFENMQNTQKSPMKPRHQVNRFV